jgi:MoaA/NifB/PqqE/SkfB family radical SAM enzyme
MRFCPSPFNTLHVHQHGYITCCPAWFNNAKEVNVVGEFENLWDMWNHEKFVRLREAWLNGDDRFCKACVLRLDPKMAKLNRGPLMQPIMTRGPFHVVFANDLTCNLHCWSCRSGPIIQKRQDKVFEQTKNILDTFHESINFITAIGSGDPFASPAWLKILQTLDAEKHKNLKIELFTNGLLLPRYWDSISQIHDNIVNVKMSIDAITPEIYERTRLGGKHKDLEIALDFVSKLGKNHILNMVVQADNFTDIPLLVERAIELGCSQVNLSMLRFWNNLGGGKEKFDKENLSNESHPKHKEFLKLLQDNEDLLSHPIVHAYRIFPEGHKIIRDNHSESKKKLDQWDHRKKQE